MKKTFSLIIVFFYQCAFSQTREKKIYFAIHNFYVQNIPNSVTANVDSSFLREQLLKIIKNKDIVQSLSIKFLFHKNYGGRLIVVGKNAVYKNLLAHFEKYFNVFYSIVSYSSYSKWRNDFDIKVIAEGSFILYKKNEKKQYYKLDFLKNGCIISIKELGSSLQRSILIKLNFKEVISKIFFLQSLKIGYKNIYLNDLQINPTLKEIDFLR